MREEVPVLMFFDRFEWLACSNDDEEDVVSSCKFLSMDIFFNCCFLSV